MAGYGPEIKERARELKAQGMSNRKIADELMIGRRTIDGWERDGLLDSSSAGNGGPPPAPVDAEALGGSGGEPAAAEQRRRHEQRPRKPDGARVQPRPQPAGEVVLDFKAVEGYIEGAYKLAGKVAAERGDEILGGVITEHAKPAAKAWSRWIESEPKVAELLRKLMVGTPAGEVIAIHVSLGFSYVLARGAAERLAAEAAVVRSQDGVDASAAAAAAAAA